MQRRRWRWCMPRWNIVVVLIIGGALARRNAPWRWRNLQFHFHLRRCMAYTASADQIVYQENASGTAARYPQPAGRRFVPLPIRQPVVSTAIIPKCWRDFPSEYKDTTHSGTWSCSCMNALHPLARGNSWYSSSRDGRGYSGNSRHPCIPTAIAPLDISFRLNPMTTQSPTWEVVTFFAGQPDPTDASHFTIGYSNSAQSGVIDCWLGNGQTIRMQIRDGPAKRP